MKTNLFAFNFRGTHGSGKSVVPTLLCRKDENRELVHRAPSSKKILFTALHKDRIVVVGGYEKSCGGVDTFIPFTTAVDAIMAAALYASSHGYDLILEGVILSSTFSGSLQIFKDLEEQFGFHVIPIYMNTPSDRCLENIQTRNGDKPIKRPDIVISKHRAVWDRQRPKMKECYKTYIFKTEDVDTEGMLLRFNRLRAKLKGE